MACARLLSQRRMRWRASCRSAAALRAAWLLQAVVRCATSPVPFMSLALLSDQGHGMLPDTVARKLFLMCNQRLWQANPGVLLPV